MTNIIPPTGTVIAELGSEHGRLIHHRGTVTRNNENSECGMRNAEQSPHGDGFAGSEMSRRAQLLTWFERGVGASPLLTGQVSLATHTADTSIHNTHLKELSFPEGSLP